MLAYMVNFMMLKKRLLFNEDVEGRKMALVILLVTNQHLSSQSKQSASRPTEQFVKGSHEFLPQSKCFFSPKNYPERGSTGVILALGTRTKV